MRKQLAKQLNGGEAFQSIEYFLEQVPFQKLGIRPEGLPYSFYEVFYHIFFAQKDIVDFIASDDYKAPAWPNDYWPQKRAPNSEKEWNDLIVNYKKDRQKLIDITINEENDLRKTVKNGDVQSLFREVLLVLEHTAYHTGQLAIILRLVNVRLSHNS